MSLLNVKADFATSSDRNSRVPSRWEMTRSERAASRELLSFFTKRY